MRIVYMGTPDFAVPPLKALVTAGHQVAGVVTQPDKRKGRGKAVQYPPVKQEAINLGLPVYQPEQARDPEFIRQLNEIAPDIIVVAAFGQLLPKEILNLPPYGCLNIHASLLPKYRGAAPIQWAVLNGEKETGITIMQMDAGLDTGDMLLKRAIPIAEKETGASLFLKLQELGGPLLLEALEKLAANSLIPEKQTGDTSYAAILTKTMGQIDWSQQAVRIERLIRGLNPWPSAYSYLHGKLIKIWDAQVESACAPGLPGEVVCVDKTSFVVKTKDAGLRILSLQPEGKKRMDAGAFLRGYPLQRGERLGDMKE